MRHFESTKKYGEAWRAKLAEFGDSADRYITSNGQGAGHMAGRVIHVNAETAAKSVVEGWADLSTPDEVERHKADNLASQAASQRAELERALRDMVTKNPASLNLLYPQLASSVAQDAKQEADAGKSVEQTSKQSKK